ncbi:MAG TPA: GatB/YqeY domain-containing protein [Candidatus Paceibacterota bacterium]
MSLHERIQSDFKSAFKNHEGARLSVLKLLQSEIKNAELGKRAKSGKEESLTDTEILDVVGREVKKRRDAGALYEKGGRPELAAREKEEEAVLKAYLPEELSESEIRDLIQEAITETGAMTAKDLGKVMAELSPKTKGRADGAVVSRIVREYLS